LLVDRELVVVVRLGGVLLVELVEGVVLLTRLVVAVVHVVAAVDVVAHDVSPWTWKWVSLVAMTPTLGRGRPVQIPETCHGRMLPTVVVDAPRNHIGPGSSGSCWVALSGDSRKRHKP